MAASAVRWRNWCRLVETHPAQVAAPTTTADVMDSVVAARMRGFPVKMVGAGHSFTDIARADGLMLLPDRLVGVTEVDHDAMTVSVLAGTPLHELNDRLAVEGLALHNMGDIDRQTVGGAIATGTHGSGGRWSSLSAQVTAVELVVGDGSLVRVESDTEPELLDAVRVGLGALGILTEVTFMVEPEFRLQAVEEPMTWDRLIATFDEMVRANHHVDVHWFPGTDRAQVKRNNRTLDGPRPLPRLRRLWDDELLANVAFAATNRLADTAPRTIPALNRIASRGLAERSYVDVAHRVFVASRRVRFREMEYALPRETGMAALTETRRLLDRSRWPVTFPLEIRSGVADTGWLSPSYGRDTVHLAFHVNARTDHTPYFGEVEKVMRANGGRPHWGKLHTRCRDDLAPDYPRFEDFLAMRDEHDPDRLFANAYLDRVLGP
jgi:L-gulono-1,4-lactone dehydrogenase